MARRRGLIIWRMVLVSGTPNGRDRPVGMLFGHLLIITVPAAHLHERGPECCADPKFAARWKRFRSLVEHLRDGCAQIGANFLGNIQAWAEVSDIDERFA